MLYTCIHTIPYHYITLHTITLHIITLHTITLHIITLHTYILYIFRYINISIHILTYDTYLYTYICTDSWEAGLQVDANLFSYGRSWIRFQKYGLRGFIWINSTCPQTCPHPVPNLSTVALLKQAKWGKWNYGQCCPLHFGGRHGGAILGCLGFGCKRLETYQL